MNFHPLSHTQIKQVNSFEALVSEPFKGEVNAMCWNRPLYGDFEEIVNKIPFTGTILELSESMLLNLSLSDAGKLARSIILNDFSMLMSIGASPTLNLIQCYERDNDNPFFATDVYSFHVDSSPIPTDTFLCTYAGAPSELLPNDQALQKILMPEIHNELKTLYEGPEEGYASYVIENCYHLHYQPKPNATIINLGLGNLWRLAVDYPGSVVKPCVHRAPIEGKGQVRLLLIC